MSLNISKQSILVLVTFIFRLFSVLFFFLSLFVCLCRLFLTVSFSLLILPLPLCQSVCLSLSHLKSVLSVCPSFSVTYIVILFVFVPLSSMCVSVSLFLSLSLPVSNCLNLCLTFGSKFISCLVHIEILEKGIKWDT